MSHVKRILTDTCTTSKVYGAIYLNSCPSVVPTVWQPARQRLMALVHVQPRQPRPPAARLALQPC